MDDDKNWTLAKADDGFTYYLTYTWEGFYIMLHTSDKFEGSSPKTSYYQEEALEIIRSVAKASSTKTEYELPLERDVQLITGSHLRVDRLNNQFFIKRKKGHLTIDRFVFEGEEANKVIAFFNEGKTHKEIQDAR